VATGWIEPGKQHLDGYHALWFARSRWSTDDYDRMRRQRCVIGAVIQQADPVQLARQFAQIAQVAKTNITTGIRLDDLDAWVALTLRVKNAQVRSLPFTSSVIDTANPDFPTIHRLVRKALNPPLASPSPSPSPATSGSPSPRSTSSPSPSPLGPDQVRKAQDINAVC
jgi:hypothetical protein